MTGNLGREGTASTPCAARTISRAQATAAPSRQLPRLPTRRPDGSSKKIPELYQQPEMDLGNHMTKVTALNLCGQKRHPRHAHRRRKHRRHRPRQETLRDTPSSRSTTSSSSTSSSPRPPNSPTSSSPPPPGAKPMASKPTPSAASSASAPPSPHGESKPDWWIIAEIAKAHRHPGFEYEIAKEVFNELCSLSPSTTASTGIASTRRTTSGPSPTKTTPAPPSFTQTKFKTANRHLQSHRLPRPRRSHRRRLPRLAHHRPPPRGLPHPHPNRPRRGIDYLLSEETLEVHPDDARLGPDRRQHAQNGQPPRRVEIKVRSHHPSPRGTVFTSFSFADIPVNILTGSGYDPVTQTAELKVCPVRIEPA